MRRIRKIPSVQERRRVVRVAVIAGVAAAVAVAGSVSAGADSPGTTTAVVRADAGQKERTDPAWRGRVVSVERLRTLSARRVTAELKGDEAGAWDTGAVRYGVDLYRVVYRTVDALGRPTTASGLLALPRNGDERLRAVSFTHGTELFKGDAPSVAKDVWGQAPALTYASAGFATVLPDYLGLGVGPGPHPWMDVPSETTASLDMLRAARSFVPKTGRQLERETLVTGFSQGASAALGLARALQEGADPWFRLGAVAPISGAYAFKDVELPALLAGDTNDKAGAIYAALTLVNFNRLHHLYDAPSEVFRSPYDETIEGLLDGTHPGREVEENTPATVGDLLTKKGRALLEHPTGPLAAALRVADGVCTDWTPRPPLRMYYAQEDEQAVSANSEHCRADLRARGADVPLIDLGTPQYGGSRHLGTQQAGTASVVRWFTSLGTPRVWN